MAVDYISEEHWTDDLTTGSQSITVPATCDIVIMGVSDFDGTGNHLDGYTYPDIDGDVFTYIGHEDDIGNTEHMWMGYLYNPSTGSQTITYNFNGGAQADYGGNLFVAYFKNSDSSTAITGTRIAISSNGTSGGKDVSGLTYNTGDMTVGFLNTYGNASGTLDESGQTQIIDTSIYRSDGISVCYEQESATVTSSGGAYVKLIACTIPVGVAGVRPQNPFYHPFKGSLGGPI